MIDNIAYAIMPQDKCVDRDVSCLNVLKSYTHSTMPWAKHLKNKMENPFGITSQRRIFVSRKEKYFEIRTTCSKVCLRVPLDAAKGANKRFIPSAKLLELIQERLLPLDSDIAEQLQYNLEEQSIASTQEIISEFENEISEEIDGLLANIARQNETVDSPVVIFTGDRFTDRFRDELIVRLGLDISDLRPFLEHMQKELIEYARSAPRRGWGEVFFERDNKNIVLKANPETF